MAQLSTLGSIERHDSRSHNSEDEQAEPFSLVLHRLELRRSAFIPIYIAGVFLRRHRPDLQPFYFDRSFHLCRHSFRLHLDFFQHSFSADISEAGFIGAAFRRFESWFRGCVYLCCVHLESIRFTTMMLPNKSPEHLTAVGAVSSAIAVHAASRRWLSFLR